MATTGCFMQPAHRLATCAVCVSWKVKQTLQGLDLAGAERAAPQGAGLQDTPIKATTAGTSVVTSAGERK